MIDTISEASNTAAMSTVADGVTITSTSTTSNIIGGAGSTSNSLNVGDAINWTSDQVLEWCIKENLSSGVYDCVDRQKIDGKCLLILTEFDIRDLRDTYHHPLSIVDIKRFWVAVRSLQRANQRNLIYLGLIDPPPPTVVTVAGTHHHASGHISGYNHHGTSDLVHLHHDVERISPPLSVDGRATSIQPEFFKTMISLGYAFLVTWITAIVMVIVHERVPDMKRYPPLPDIFLDNVPHIPWAFHMCEITGTLLFTLWTCVLIVHKHRMVLLRRFFALSGTVFLLRCVTMLITSLSVPGTHLQCNPNDYKVDDTNLTVMESVLLRISRAYAIWSGLGMSIQGVRTCGDYMFSGHTVALTIFNFFITEYTPRHLYFLHTMTWLLNMFGIFFILAAHEHYSIDVFVAFYITSRLFLYYHTLANNQALMSHDSNRTRIWFPMFSYFESSVDGIIPNEYDSLGDVCSNIFTCIIYIKDCCMLTARRFWIAHNQLPPLPKSLIRPANGALSNSFISKNLNNLVISSNKRFNGLGRIIFSNADDNEQNAAGTDSMEDNLSIPTVSSVSIKTTASAPLLLSKKDN